MESGHRVQGIRQVAITVADVDAALGFYRDVLGLAFLFRAGPAWRSWTPTACGAC